MQQTQANNSTGSQTPVRYLIRPISVFAVLTTFVVLCEHLARSELPTSAQATHDLHPFHNTTCTQLQML